MMFATPPKKNKKSLPQILVVSDTDDDDDDEGGGHHKKPQEENEKVYNYKPLHDPCAPNALVLVTAEEARKKLDDESGFGGREKNKVPCVMKIRTTTTTARLAAVGIVIPILSRTLECYSRTIWDWARRCKCSRWRGQC